MKLFSPENDGTLGYVNHSYNPKNPYQQIGNFFIGTGPIWGGVLLLYVASYFLLPEGILNLTNGLPETLKLFFNHLISPEFWTNWQSYLWLYIVLAVSSHITLSQPDIQGALLGSIFLTNGFAEGCTSLEAVYIGKNVTIDDGYYSSAFWYIAEYDSDYNVTKAPKFYVETGYSYSYVYIVIGVYEIDSVETQLSLPDEYIVQNSNEAEFDAYVATLN
jgi:hypothetical protein